MIALSSLGGVDPILDRFAADSFENAWTFRMVKNVGKGESQQYAPQKDDFQNSLLLGFVHSSLKPEWNTVGVPNETDNIRVFTTFVISNKDQIIPLRLEGDDGHSAFVQGRYVGGGGYDAKVDFDLSLKANTPVFLELAGYNAQGAFCISLKRRDNGQLLESTPGIALKAMLVPNNQAQVQNVPLSEVPKAENKAKTPNTVKTRKNKQSTVAIPTGPSPEVSIRRLNLAAAFGIVEISGQVRNLKNEPIDGLSIGFLFYKGRNPAGLRTVHMKERFNPGEWKDFSFRFDAFNFNDYQLSIRNGRTEPLLWMIE
jgi:hypothetical protein